MGTSWLSITGLLLAIGLALVANMWWCGRQYYRARGKGYQPAPAATVVVAGAVAAFGAVVVGDVLISDSTWSGAAKYAVVLLTFFPVPALVVTALVALMPRRLRRAGPRSSSFFLIAPAPRAWAPVDRLAYALVRLAKGVRIPHWEQFAAELEQTGLHLPPTEPGPGSVVAFDAAGRAEVVVRGAQQPEEFVAAVRTHLAREGQGQPPTLP